MSLPLATTTISILRTSVVDDSLTDTTTTVYSGVPAVIKEKKSGSQDVVGGDKSVSRFELNADTSDLQHTDFVVDEQTGDRFNVMFSVYRPGFGLDHTFAELQRTQGMA